MSDTLPRARTNVDASFQETWSAGFLQDVNRLQEEANVTDALDRTHIVKGYLAWELPLAKGRRFMNNASGVTELLLGGWTASTIVRYQSGRPLRHPVQRLLRRLVRFRLPDLRRCGAERRLLEQVQRRLRPAEHCEQPLFRPALFSNPEYGDFGKGPGYFKQLRAFGQAYEDVSLMRTFAIAGRYNLEVRLDLLNAFNRHYLADPVTDSGSPDFGYVTGLAPASNFGAGSSPSRQVQIGVRFEF